MKDPGTFTCDHCGELQPLSECTIFNSQHLCLNCLSEQTTFCSCCGERIWNDANAGKTKVIGTNPDAVRRAIKLYNTQQYSIKEVEELTKVKKSTLYRDLQGEANHLT